MLSAPCQSIVLFCARAFETVCDAAAGFFFFFWAFLPSANAGQAAMYRSSTRKRHLRAKLLAIRIVGTVLLASPSAKRRGRAACRLALHVCVEKVKKGPIFSH